MRALPPMNAYQQMLYSALALVEEADLLAIFRAARTSPERNECIEMVNVELDKGLTLMQAFAEPSALHGMFTDNWPELRVLVSAGNVVDLDFGVFGRPDCLMSWRAHMAGTGVVGRIECMGRYYSEAVYDEGDEVESLKH